MSFVLMFVVLTIQKILLKKFFEAKTVKISSKRHQNIIKTFMILTFIVSATPLQASESQGFLGGMIESIKGFFKRANPFSGDSKTSEGEKRPEGEKRLEHYDSSKNEKLEAGVNGPSAVQNDKKDENKEDYGRVIESEEFIGEAYPKITEAAKEAAPSNPKDKKDEKNPEEVSKVKEELAKEESKEDLKNKIYSDLENDTVATDKKLNNEAEGEKNAEKKVADKMQKTGKEIVAAQPELGKKADIKK